MLLSKEKPGLAKLMAVVFAWTLVVGLVILGAVLIGIPPTVAGIIGALLSMPMWAWVRR